MLDPVLPVFVSSTVVEPIFIFRRIVGFPVAEWYPHAEIRIDLPDTKNEDGKVTDPLPAQIKDVSAVELAFVTLAVCENIVPGDGVEFPDKELYVCPGISLQGYLHLHLLR